MLKIVLGGILGMIIAGPIGGLILAITVAILIDKKII